MVFMQGVNPLLKPITPIFAFHFLAATTNQATRFKSHAHTGTAGKATRQRPPWDRRRLAGQNCERGSQPPWYRLPEPPPVCLGPPQLASVSHRTQREEKSQVASRRGTTLQMR